MTSFTLVHGNSPTMLGSINGLGIDGVFESPVGPENTDIEAFYGYDISIKKHCVSYEGNGGLGGLKSQNYTKYQEDGSNLVNCKECPKK